MADGVDTSSYPKELPSLVDKVKGFQQLESNALSIDQKQLDLTNQRYGHLMREIQSLGPDATTDDLVRVGQNAVKNKLIKPDMFSNFVKAIPTDPKKVGGYVQETLSKLLDTQSAINYHAGNMQFFQQGQQATPVRITNKPTVPAIRAAGAPIQLQNPPNTDVTTPEGTKLLGPQQAQIPEGTMPVEGGIPGQFQPVPQQRSGGLPVAAPQVPAQTPAGPATSQPPMFEEGKAQYAKALELGTQRRTQNIRLKTALNLMPNLTTGIGTEPFQKAVAALQNAGIITQDNNGQNPTALYQQINKYLAQSLVETGSRSDADLANKAMGSPDITKQISPALIDLTKKQIAFNRIDAARGVTFKDRDMSKFPTHASKFPSTIDAKAFGLDMMEPKERNKLLDDMSTAIKDKDGNEKRVPKNTPAAKKFWDSLRIANDEKLFDEAQ